MNKKDWRKEWLNDKLGDITTLYGQYSIIYGGAGFFGAKVYKDKRQEILDFISKVEQEAEERGRREGKKKLLEDLIVIIKNGTVNEFEEILSKLSNE